MGICKFKKAMIVVAMVALLLSSCQKKEIKTDEPKANKNETVKVDIDEKEKANINETVKAFLVEKYYKIDKNADKV